MNYTDANIHQRINYKGNNENRAVAFGNLPIGYGKKVGALTAMLSPWDEKMYACNGLNFYNRGIRREALAKYPN